MDADSSASCSASGQSAPLHMPKGHLKVFDLNNLSDADVLGSLLWDKLLVVKEKCRAPPNEAKVARAYIEDQHDYFHHLSYDRNIGYNVIVVANFSPAEFYVQLESVQQLSIELVDLLEANIDLQSCLSQDLIKPGMPCVVWNKQLSKFCRGRIEMVGLGEHHVTHSDLGTRAFYSDFEIFPLSQQFTEIPPLALPCRLHRVDTRDLFITKVDAFERKLVALNRRLVCTFMRYDPELRLFDVVVYQPSTGENIGYEYCRHSKRKMNI